MPALVLSEAVEEFDLHLRVRNRSPATRTSYTTSVRQFAAFTGDMPVAKVTKRNVEEFLVSVLETRTSSTAVTRWGGLLAFFKWATAEGLTRRNPMDGVTRPTKEERVVEVVPREVIDALLAATSGRSHDEIRDHAIIRMLCTTGMRRSELAGLRLQDVNLREQTALVMGKGRRERLVHVEDRTMVALQRYLRARAHRLEQVRREGRPWATTDRLWIGKGGPMADTGIDQMIRRRGRALGVEGLHAHRFRHSFAHGWLAAGGTEGGLMATAGWRSRAMLNRYAASAASERARAEHARLNLGGDL